MKLVIFFYIVFITISTSYKIFNNKFSLRPYNLLNAKPKHKVTIQNNGKETVLEVSEDCSVLEAAIDAGVELPYDCKMGVCLTCPSKVVSGILDQTGSTLDDSVIAKGFALTCCAYPRSDVVIRSIDEDELVNAQFSDRQVG